MARATVIATDAAEAIVDLGSLCLFCYALYVCAALITGAA